MHDGRCSAVVIQSVATCLRGGGSGPAGLLLRIIMEPERGSDVDLVPAGGALLSLWGIFLGFSPPCERGNVTAEKHQDNKTQVQTIRDSNERKAVVSTPSPLHLYTPQHVQVEKGKQVTVLGFSVGFRAEGGGYSSPPSLLPPSLSSSRAWRTSAGLHSSLIGGLVFLFYTLVSCVCVLLLDCEI